MEKSLSVKDLIIVVLLVVLGFVLFSNHQPSSNNYQGSRGSYSNGNSSPSSSYSPYHKSYSKSYGSTYGSGSSSYSKPSYPSSTPSNCISYDGDRTNDHC